MSYRKEVRLTEILRQLGAMTDKGGDGSGKWLEKVKKREVQHPGSGTEQEHLFQLGMPGNTASPTLGHDADPMLRDAMAKVALYLQVQRDIYHPIGHPLDEARKDGLRGFFAPALLDRVRIVELKERRVANPWFYPEARAKGIENLPDISHKAAVTFLDVVVFNQEITQRDLFHGLVHAAQFKLLGIEQFTELFVRGFLRARSYFLIPLKAHAFALDTRYYEDPQTPFSVEEEIRRWHEEGRY